MDLTNFKKRFETHFFKRPKLDIKEFGITRLVASEKIFFKGFLDRKNGQLSDKNDKGILSKAVLFTLKDVMLENGDVVNDKCQVIDTFQFSQHNEYALSCFDRWGNE